jgi:hypothetical protein
MTHLRGDLPINLGMAAMQRGAQCYPMPARADNACMALLGPMQRQDF